MYELPTSIEIDNHHFAITNKGDYRMVIDCFIALEDPELEKQDRILTAMIIFYEDLEELEDINDLFGEHVLEACEKMFLFFNCGQASIGHKVNHKLLDWQQDAQLIISAVNNVANKEVRAESYIHWWTFMGYYMSIGESVFSTVVSIRDKIVKGKKLEKYEREFQHNNPEYFTWNRKTADEQELDNFVKEMWSVNDGE